MLTIIIVQVVILNFCRKCYSYHKVIFKDNILDFEGYFSKNGKKNGLGITYKLNNEINFIANWENDKYDLINTIPHSHNNIYREDYHLDYICDVCSKECGFYDTGMNCEECGLNICDLCIIKIN